MDVSVNPRLLKILLFIPFLFFSFAIHEFAHAFFADKFGDDTPRREGRLTLNPLKHLDLLGSVVIPFVGLASGGFIIGWAKPVHVVRSNFRDPRLHDIIVSLAGSVANLLTAIALALLLNLFGGFLSPLLLNVFALVVYFNVFLFFFNLLPIPPLDGTHILFNLFPNEYTYKYLHLGSFGLILLFLFVYSPLWNLFVSLVSFVTRLLI